MKSWSDFLFGVITGMTVVMTLGVVSVIEGWW